MHSEWYCAGGCNRDPGTQDFCNLGTDALGWLLESLSVCEGWEASVGPGTVQAARLAVCCMTGPDYANWGRGGMWCCEVMWSCWSSGLALWACAPPERPFHPQRQCNCGPSRARWGGWVLQTDQREDWRGCCTVKTGLHSLLRGSWEHHERRLTRNRQFFHHSDSFWGMGAHSKMDLPPATPASGVGPLASDAAEQSL